MGMGAGAASGVGAAAKATGSAAGSTTGAASLGASAPGHSQTVPPTTAVPAATIAARAPVPRVFQNVIASPSPPCGTALCGRHPPGVHFAFDKEPRYHP